jgi:transposase
MRPIVNAKIYENRRIYAIGLLQQGKNDRQVASELRVAPRSVGRWREKYSRYGFKGIWAKPRPGRPCFLSAEEKIELEELLLNGAKCAGFETDLWTCPRVVELIRRNFGVHYHVDHIGRLLHSLGWSPQKPQRQAVEHDKEAAQQWIKKEWTRIKKKPGN